MKQKIWIGGVSLLAVVILGLVVSLASREPAHPAQAQTTPLAGGPNGYSGISVNGTGIILVKPDVVRVSIGTDQRGNTVTEVQKLAADASAQIMAALKTGGVKEDDIKTDSYNIRPEYNYLPNQPPKLTGYTVSNLLAVTIRDINKAGDIIDAAGAAGATQIGGINFTLDNNEDALKQARTAAMEDAQKKAEQFAAAGKIGAGSVIKIVEQTQNLGPRPQQDAFAAGSAAAPALAAARTVIEGGQFRVVVNVDVTYAIK